MHNPETSRGRTKEGGKGAKKIPIYAEGKRPDVCSFSRTPRH